MTAVLDLDIRRKTSAETQESTDSLCREASALLEACGIGRSRSWVSRTVRDYQVRVQLTGYPFAAWLLNRVQLNAEQRLRILHDPELAYLLAYADPTGETAVRNIVRGRHGA